MRAGESRWASAGKEEELALPFQRRQALLSPIYYDALSDKLFPQASPRPILQGRVRSENHPISRKCRRRSDQADFGRPRRSWRDGKEGFLRASSQIWSSSGESLYPFVAFRASIGSRNSEEGKEEENEGRTKLASSHLILLPSSLPCSLWLYVLNA